MRIDLQRIKEKPLSWQETIQPTDPAAVGEVDFSARLSYAEPGYLLRGRLRYDQTLRCDRCLREVPQAVDTPLELLILTHEEAPEAREQELEEQDLSILHVSGDILDTEPLVAEQVQLNVPMKPLCREDCAGLCSVCGADLNEEQCHCERRPPDPRWAALAALKGRLNEG
jgi:uncharacterized protein